MLSQYKMRTTLFLLSIFVALITLASAKGGRQPSFDRNSSKSRSGLSFDRNLSKGKSGLFTPRPVKTKVPKLSPTYLEIIRLSNFISTNARKFSGPTRVCLYSCKTHRSPHAIFKCAKACFAQACLKKIPGILNKCHHGCAKIFSSRRKCKRVCSKISKKLSSKCKF